MRNVGENLTVTTISAPIFHPLAGQTPDPLLEGFKKLVAQLPGLRTTLFVAGHNNTPDLRRTGDNDLIAELANSFIVEAEDGSAPAQRSFAGGLQGSPPVLVCITLVCPANPSLSLLLRDTKAGPQAQFPSHLSLR